MRNFVVWLTSIPHRGRELRDFPRALLLALAFVCVAVPAFAIDPPAFVRAWGDSGSMTPGLFREPYDVGLDAAGNVYVSDTINNRIQKFTANGVFLLLWGGGGSANGQMLDPVGLTVDAASAVYVAEFTGDRVQKFTNTGGFITKFGSTGTTPGKFRTADDVAIDPNGNAWVVDKDNHRIQKFTSAGTFLAAYGDSGLGPGQFIFPVGIAIDSLGNIFVAEQGRSNPNLPVPGGNRIQKFDLNFNFISMWGTGGGNGTRGSAFGEFNEPIHLSVDRHGNVFVPDSKNHRIQVFDNDGVFLTAWGTQGSDTSEFLEPEGVVVGLDERIYVADTQNERIQEFLFAQPFPGPVANLFLVPSTIMGPVDAVVTIQVRASTNLDIGFLQFALEYDQSAIELLSVDTPTGLPAGFYHSGVETDYGPPLSHAPQTNNNVLVQVFGQGGSTSFTGVQPIADLTFRIKSGSGGTSPIRFSTTCQQTHFATAAPYEVICNPTLIHGSLKRSLTSDVLPQSPRRNLTVFQNTPNPFNPSTTIRFELSQAEHVRVRLFDVRGRIVRLLWDQPSSPGLGSVLWDGRDHAGQLLPSGVYFYEVSTPTESETKRMLMLK